MEQKNEQKAPLRIKNLAELKRCIRPGTELVATSQSKHPALVGLVRVVTEVQTNAYYSVVKDQPSHQYSTCNYGKGFRSDFEKASNYLFEGTTIKVLDRRSSDGSVLYEMELYPGEYLVLFARLFPFGLHIKRIRLTYSVFRLSPARISALNATRPCQPALTPKAVSN